ncbi:GHMP kinase [Candidatus Bathyarchaeota archaeon]|nr:GHMP kinase [Candidatus Bathyarchaeota archaeon]
MRKAKAYAPGHITGFFQICDSPTDPLMRGSRGSGVSITQGVYTEVITEPSDLTSYTIYINDIETKGAFVSENVIKKYLSYTQQPSNIIIKHTVETPLGSGFGSSGGGALTLSLALNETLETGLSLIDAARIAHIAEIECKTGLGTVFAALFAGFGILYRPGGPGIGEAVKYKKSEDLRLVYLHFGPIETKLALSDPLIRKKINDLGGRFVDQIYTDHNPKLFMELARQFTDHVGMVTPNLRRVFKVADKAKIPVAMAMFGEVAFSLIEKKEAARVARIFEESSPGYEAIIVGIDNEGARLID